MLIKYNMIILPQCNGFPTQPSGISRSTSKSLRTVFKTVKCL